MDIARAFLDQSRTYLRGDYLPKIERALAALPDGDLWWRPNDASNSAGNLGLHLAGNVRQWVVAGLGGAEDVRERDTEFSADGGLDAEAVLDRLRASVDDACAVLDQLDAEALARSYSIQAHDVTGLQAVYHVVEHFGMHTGQILWIAKARAGSDLGFYTERPGGLAKLAWVATPDGPIAP